MFIQSPIDGHLYHSIDVLGCRHLLAIVTNTSVNGCVQIPLQDPVSVLWGMYSAVELLDSMVILSLISLGTLFCFLTSQPFYIPTNSISVLQVLHILANTFFLIVTILIWYKVVFHCDLICMCLLFSDIEPLFVCLWAICVLLWRNVCSIVLSIL